LTRIANGKPVKLAARSVCPVNTSVTTDAPVVIAPKAPTLTKLVMVPTPIVWPVNANWAIPPTKKDGISRITIWPLVEKKPWLAVALINRTESGRTLVTNTL
jgi:hypothetical protein